MIALFIYTKFNSYHPQRNADLTQTKPDERWEASAPAGQSVLRRYQVPGSGTANKFSYVCYRSFFGWVKINQLSCICMRNYVLRNVRYELNPTAQSFYIVDLIIYLNWWSHSPARNSGVTCSSPPNTSKNVKLRLSAEPVPRPDYFGSLVNFPSQCPDCLMEVFSFVDLQKSDADTITESQVWLADSCWSFRIVPTTMLQNHSKTNHVYMR